jgi:hypothetical protein
MGKRVTRAEGSPRFPGAVAVETALCPVGLGPPTARIPASGTTALGSRLGLEHRSARRARDVARGRVGGWDPSLREPCQHEPSGPGLRAEEREAEERKGLRGPFQTPRLAGRVRELAEHDQARLVGVKLQREASQSLTKRVEEPLGIRLVLESNWRTRSSALRAPSIRFRARGAFCSSMSPSARPRPSTLSAADDSALFEGFAGNMGPSDLRESCIIGVRPPAFPMRPTAPSAVSDPRISRFSRRKIARVRGVSDRARAPTALRGQRRACCLPLRLTTSAPRIR